MCLQHAPRLLDVVLEAMHLAVPPVHQDVSELGDRQSAALLVVDLF